MERKKIEEAIKAKIIAKEGKQYIPCATALKIAEDLHAPTSEVGKVCDDMKVKIMKCQLGCF
ncbi:MAG TPA: hypothetical protein PKK00_08200 [Bacteroidales bacterium]|nr:hypothetical protein [Bacteroidales bacterium]HPS17321.1 hypothetical protein [Bacteroidales bacterium]